MAQKVFLNDKISDSEESKISVTDSGFLYGVGLFETVRANNGVVFAMEDHVSRMLTSATALGISCGYEPPYIEEAVYKTLAANELTSARLRVTLTSGSMAEAGQEPRSTLLVTASSFEPYAPEYYENGASIILSQFRQNPLDPITGHKTINYLSRLLALNLAKQKRAVEAIWFTTDNRLAEGSVSNIFLVKDGEIYTPPLNTPVLPGIIRKYVCQIAARESIEVIEDDLFISDVLSAGEIFLTNTVMHILPVVKVEAHQVGDGKVGALTKKLSAAFADVFANGTNK